MSESWARVNTIEKSLNGNGTAEGGGIEVCWHFLDGGIILQIVPRRAVAGSLIQISCDDKNYCRVAEPADGNARVLLCDHRGYRLNGMFLSTIQEFAILEVEQRELARSFYEYSGIDVAFLEETAVLRQERATGFADLTEWNNGCFETQRKKAAADFGERMDMTVERFRASLVSPIKTCNCCPPSNPRFDEKEISDRWEEQFVRFRAFAAAHPELGPVKTVLAFDGLPTEPATPLKILGSASKHEGVQ
jgi:hypothetical protein